MVVRQRGARVKSDHQGRRVRKKNIAMYDETYAKERR